MNFGGIDPGLKGGIAFINNGILHVWPTPLIGDHEYDVQGMKDLLMFAKQAGPVFFVLERQGSMPGQGLSSTFQTGAGYGIWMGLLSGMNIAFQVTPPQRWQKVLFVGLSKRNDTKENSALVAKRLFPTSIFLRSDRSKKIADGMTDAACIAEFARREYQPVRVPDPSELPFAPVKDPLFDDIHE